MADTCLICAGALTSDVCADCAAEPVRAIATPRSSFQEFLAEQAAQAATAQPVTLPYDRTPLQVLLLGYATLGLYHYYWLIRATRMAEERLEPRERLSFWTLLVPIWNMITYFSGLKTIEDRVRADAIRPLLPFWVFGVAGLAFVYLWRLPKGYGCIEFLAPVWTALLHVYVMRAELAEGLSPKNKLTMWEIVILIGGLPTVMLFIALYGFIDNGAAAIFVSGVATVMVLTAPLFLYLGFATKRSGNERRM
jgi:hypothetical protein